MPDNPTDPDGVIDVVVGDQETSNGDDDMDKEPCPEDTRSICCDLDCDLMQIALKDSTDGHTVLMEETRGSIAIGHQVFRGAAAAKFRDVDPVEAAAVEAILNGVARND